MCTIHPVTASNNKLFSFTTGKLSHQLHGRAPVESMVDAMLSMVKGNTTVRELCGCGRRDTRRIRFMNADVVSFNTTTTGDSSHQLYDRDRNRAKGQCDTIVDAMLSCGGVLRCARGVGAATASHQLSDNQAKRYACYDGDMK